ncbi:MAG: transposase [Bacteroidota bacterium]
MTKYKNKYRIESARKPGWDYRNSGAYFITICTHQRQHFFGECTDGKMTLSAIGAIVQGFWFEIPKHFDHVQLGEFVAMPNHVHGVLILGNDGVRVKTGDGAQVDMQDGARVETRQCHVSTSHEPPPDDKRNAPDFYKKIVPKSGSVSVIIGSFKSICTKHIRKSFPDVHFKWQERFHDHIIRNDASFRRISEYIVQNPTRWKEDKFY